MARKPATPRAWSWHYSRGVLYVYRDSRWQRCTGERVNDLSPISLLEQKVIQTRWQRARRKTEPGRTAG